MLRRIAALVTLMSVAMAAAHVPAFNEAGGSADAAFVLDDPGKSWVFYDELEQDSQHWFQFDMTAGTALSASLNLPAREPARPTLWVVGPGLPGAGPVGTPEGLGGVRATTQDELSIEPFSPMALRAIAEWRGAVPQTGTYFIVVESSQAAAYNVGIGARESFTPIEWASIPVERVAIQQWGGVPGVFAVTGEILGIVAGIVYARRNGLSALTTVGLAGAGAVAGTAVTMTILALVAAVEGGVSAALIIPFVFAGAALGIGHRASRLVLNGGTWWAGLAWAAAALLVWSGLLVGPALLLVWSVWAQRRPPATPAGASRKMEMKGLETVT